MPFGEKNVTGKNVFVPLHVKICNLSGKFMVKKWEMRSLGKVSRFDLSPLNGKTIIYGNTGIFMVKGCYFDGILVKFL